MGNPAAAMAPSTEAQHLAERVRDHMFANDRASQAMGMEVVAVGPGTSTVRMTVREDMLNGYAIAHGGLVATLADSAFAFACNACGEMTVASGFSVELLAPSRLGDVLTASAFEASKAGRTGVYDIEVRNQRDERVAMFRGRSYTLKGRPALPARDPAA
jgi:acyl-CoA thioesterase